MQDVWIVQTVMRRQRADWMNPIDDQILEILDESGAGTPKSLAIELERNNDYVGVRCRLLTTYGMLKRPSRGLYTLTKTGRKYLNGEVDASCLSRTS